MPQKTFAGSKLYGLNDEKLGKIDDVIFDHFTGVISYVVVDTGGWLSTKKFIVPADRLRASAEHKDDFAADLTKAQVEAFRHIKSRTWSPSSSGRTMKAGTGRSGRRIR